MVQGFSGSKYWLQLPTGDIIDGICGNPIKEIAMASAPDFPISGRNVARHGCRGLDS